jgi:ribonucleoside-diphosphate reductase alpha chain
LVRREESACLVKDQELLFLGEKFEGILVREMKLEQEKAVPLTDFARQTLQGRYTYRDERPEDIFGRVAKAYGSNPAHSKRLLSYMHKLWLIPASPILANGGTSRGLPISCYLNECGDSIEGIGNHIQEVLYMTTRGGGIGTYFGDVRSKGEKTSRGTETTGALQFMHIIDSVRLASNQGNARQGTIAEWISIDHPEIEEFILMRRLEGDVHRLNRNLDHGVSIPDEFMRRVANDEPWQLRDPHSGNIIKTIPAAQLWELLLTTRAGVGRGEPYIHFVDRSNEHLHPDLKEQGMKIKHLNLCTEVCLPTSEDYSNICALSSVNVEHFDEWSKCEEFIHDCVEYLDNVVTDFINKAPEPLWRARKAAEWERSVGLGQMGFHSYLQRHMIPFESPTAIAVNLQIARFIHSNAMQAKRQLTQERGPAKGLKSDRMAHVIAIAPNATTSIIADTSPSIEPWDSNYFLHKTISGAFPVKNKHLEKLLQGRFPDDLEGVWHSILTHEGSVQQLDRLSDLEKDVYKTAYEINQKAVIKLAADRQPYICQSQSVNLFFPARADRAYVDDVHFSAWKQGLKSLYYYRTKSELNGSAVSFDTDCVACEG